MTGIVDGTSNMNIVLVLPLRLLNMTEIDSVLLNYEMNVCLDISSRPIGIAAATSVCANVSSYRSSPNKIIRRIHCNFSKYY